MSPWPWIGGLAAVLMETWFRTHREVPYLWQWPAIPLAFVVNYSIYRIMRSADSLLAGFVVFSTVTLGLRIVMSLWFLGELVTWRTWLALGLLTAAKFLLG